MSRRPIRNRLILYVVLLLIVIALMWWVSTLFSPHKKASLSNRDWASIRQEGTLRMLVQYNSQDYYVNGDSTLGFVYELSRRLSERLKLPIDLVLETNWMESVEKLYDGRVDVIAQAVPQTSDTDTTKFRFLDPLSEGRIFLVRRKSDIDKDEERQLSLRGDTIFLPTGVPARLFIKHLSEEMGDTIFTVFDPLYSSEQLAMKVAAGSIRYTVCYDRDRKKISEDWPDLDVSLPLSFGVIETWLVRQSAHQLSDTLNAALMNLREEGYIDSLAHVYFQHPSR